MPTMRIAVVTRLKAPFEIVERQISEPPAGSVRVKVEACGVCHSDSITKEGLFPGIEYPRAPGHEIAGVVDAIGANLAGWKQGERVGVGWHGGHCGYSDSITKEGLFPGIAYPRAPGHEIAGVVDAIGANVAGWKQGERVGVGWHGGHCGYCDSCRRGDFVTCQVALQIPGISYDGGYADYAIAPAAALARIPEKLSFVEAAPLMCAGVTTFNSLRHSGARPGISSRCSGSAASAISG